jgi:hypothetical protein
MKDLKKIVHDDSDDDDDDDVFVQLHALPQKMTA